MFTVMCLLSDMNVGVVNNDRETLTVATFKIFKFWLIAYLDFVGLDSKLLSSGINGEPK